MPANNGQPPFERPRPLPGLEPGDPVIAARVDRAQLVHGPAIVADVLSELGQRFNGEWDLLMIAVPVDKARRVMDALTGQ